MNMFHDTVFTNDYVIAYTDQFGWNASFELVGCIYDGNWCAYSSSFENTWESIMACRILRIRRWKL